MASSEPKVGYPALAHVMGAPSLIMLRRFAALNSRNLVYVQAKLLPMECELPLIAELDHGEDSDDQTKKYATSCEAFIEGDGL